MKPGSVMRRALVFGALALTLAAVKWVNGNDAGAPSSPVREPRVRTEVAAPAGARAPATLKPAAAPVDLDLSRVSRGRAGKVPDAFAPRSWQPVPSPAAIREMQARENLPPPPPPPPQAPPVPFTYVGRLTEADRTTVFLSTGSRDVAAAVGETIDGTYRVEAVTASRIELTYLPLGQRQSLTLRTP